MNDKGQNIGIMGLMTSDGFDLSPSNPAVFVSVDVYVTEDDLKAIGIDKTGHRRKDIEICRQIEDDE